MADSWNKLDGDTQARILEEAKAETLTDELLSDAHDHTLDNKPGSRAEVFRTLYRVVNGPMPMTEELNNILRRDPDLARDYQQLLARTSFYQFPMAAAASSGGVEARIGDGFDITLKPSRAAPNQVYVLITIKPGAIAQPKLLFVTTSDGGSLKQPLPDPLNGVIQILTEEGTPLVDALKNTKTEVYLR